MGVTNIPEVGWAAMEKYIIGTLVKYAKELQEDKEEQPYWTDLWQLGVEGLAEGYQHRFPDAEEYIRRLLSEEDDATQTG